MLDRENTLLLVVDIQGNLAQQMYEKEVLFRNVRKLIQGIQVLGLPIVWAEQIPEKLGPTIPEVANLLTGMRPIPKSSFSCCGNPDIMQAIEKNHRQQVLVCGIEVHICVYQTSAELVSKGYAVQVVADAVSSRQLGNKEIGLAKAREAGASITSVETVLFELMQKAEGDEFRQLVKIVK
jgi:nicotinamidase-related amidase